MDIFDKCLRFTRASEARTAGLYPYFRAAEGCDGPVVAIGGRRIIMAGSNNYLGLTTDPRVTRAVMDAVGTYGTSCSGSRYMTGTIDLHNKLEARLARFLGYEDALVISTGYQTAQAIIPTLAQRGEYVISDKDNHASIASANVMATGLGARVLRYRPGDMGNLEEILASIPHEAPKLIVTDGVFSTTGTIADLTGITRLARRHNARVMCDDAHAVGVLGPGGRGTAAHFGLTAEVDVTMGTFSKSLASLGGFVAAPRAVIDYIRHMAPSLIFSASPTPASAAAALAALDIIEAEPERIARLHANAARVRQGLETLGFRVFGHADTGIVSVLIGDEYTTILFTKELFDAGIFVNPFVKPGVPEGREMIRTSYMSTHEDEHLDRVIEAFAVIGTRLGLIGGGAMAPAV